jgi:hypothetical protein
MQSCRGKRPMKKEELVKKLEELSYPEIESASYKRRLKMALLSSRNFDRKGLLGFFPGINWLKELTMFKKITFSVATVAIVAALVVGGVAISGIINSSTVSAETLVNRAITQVAAANPQVIQPMESKMQMKLSAFLSDAQQAKDLTIIDKSAVENALAENQVEVVAEMPNVEAVKYLRFTRNDSTFIFGLDSSNLLVWFAQTPETPEGIQPRHTDAVNAAKENGIDPTGMTDLQIKQAIIAKSPETQGKSSENSSSP